MGKDKKDKSEKKEKGDKEKKDKKEKKEGGLDAQEMDHRKLFKEGQKAITPPVADATRAFYESLLAEIPDSKIAIKWCVEYGVLPLEQHKKILKTYNNLKDKGEFSMQQKIKQAIDKKIQKAMLKKGGTKLKKDKKDK